MKGQEIYSKAEEKTKLKQLFIAESEVEGKGLFTKFHIDPGTHIFSIIGSFKEHGYSKEFSQEGENWIGAQKNVWLIPQPHNPVHYINHSCQPNCFVTESFTVSAMKPIHPREELTIDYSMTEIDPFWNMECNCGNKNCRKLLLPFQKLPKEIQLKYWMYMPKRLVKAL